MNPLRKIIGLLVIVFIGIPTLFVIIWAVGLTRAAVSPELISDLPQEVINEIPYFIDDVYNSLQNEDEIDDQRVREWIQASKKAGFSPRDLIEEIGLMEWLRTELSRSLREIGEILRGEIPPRSIILDLRPLKQTFQHPAIERDFLKTIENLPPCESDQLEIWARSADDEFFKDSLPACRPPDMEIAKKTLQNIRFQIVDDIPNDVDIFENAEYFPRGISVSKSVVSLAYLLFFIPIIFILIGSLIAASSKPDFFRWAGISTLAGGVPALLLALLVRNIVPWISNHFPYINSSHHIPFDVHEVVFDNLGGVIGVILDKLFSPVVAVAGAVCIIGVIFFAFSFAFAGETGSKSRPFRDKRVAPETSESEENSRQD